MELDVINGCICIWMQPLTLTELRPVKNCKSKSMHVHGRRMISVRGLHGRACNSIVGLL